MLIISKTFEFAASHRLYRPEWDAAKNSAVFGKCANPNGHGHNYRLEVAVCGELDPETGMVLDASELDRIVNLEILNDLDHANLNVDVTWLEAQIPTTEVLVEAIWGRLCSALESNAHSCKLQRLRLWETSRIFAEKSLS